jgi:hypothetical protein
MEKPATGILWAVWVTAGLAACSTLLYFTAACYFFVATATEEHVRPGDMPLRGGIGDILAALMAGFGLLCLATVVRGRRFRRRGKDLDAVTTQIAAAALGLIPLYRLLSPWCA